MRKQMRDTRSLMAQAAQSLEASRVALMGQPDLDLEEAQRATMALRLMGAALTALGAGSHVYLSTSCEHETHGYCSSRRGSNGETVWDKKPAECKFCDSPCVCWCHWPPHRADAARR
ncbi:hypothetical protein Strvi_0017 (plasmid) [Streptomyces violaceusniger Tu 4113]|uniref:Uncharacterized protein n=2 Tax=Streptomyces violaceusniger TaxID=68280 RepID=G2PHE8_STRV4|nr:hypothetical protein Strvi_0017 [Streptomyces violaceusniger Tu 4113]